MHRQSSSTNVTIKWLSKIWKIKLMGRVMFQPVNSFAFNKNWWLILLSNILIFKNVVQNTLKCFYNSQDSKYALIFFQLQWSLSYWQFYDFSLNKSCKTYQETAMPPSGTNWQLIYPNFIVYSDLNNCVLITLQYIIV